jgi:hypothetical protein
MAPLLNTTLNKVTQTISSLLLTSVREQMTSATEWI